MSGFNQGMQATAQPQAMAARPQGQPFSSPYSSMPAQFALMQGGFPMPNTQAARWNGRPAQAVQPAPVNNTGMSTPGITSQLQALQSQLSSMQSAASAKSPGIRFRNDG